jgi:hypothetical protein
MAPAPIKVIDLRKSLSLFPDIQRELARQVQPGFVLGWSILFRAWYTVHVKYLLGKQCVLSDLRLLRSVRCLGESQGLWKKC